MGEDTAHAARVALGRDYTETFEVASSVLPDLKGAVTVGVPDGREILKIGLLQHRLREGVPLEQLDELTRATVILISTLTVVVRQAPDWWYRINGAGAKEPAPEQVTDLALLWDIYGRYVAFRDTFPGRSGHPATGSPAA